MKINQRFAYASKCYVNLNIRLYEVHYSLHMQFKQFFFVKINLCNNNAFRLSNFFSVTICFFYAKIFCLAALIKIEKKSCKLEFFLVLFRHVFRLSMSNLINKSYVGKYSAS